MPQLFSSFGDSGLKASGLAFNLPFNVPGLRFLTGLIGTSLATGCLPRAMITSLPLAASSTSCESMLLALCMVYIMA